MRALKNTIHNAEKVTRIIYTWRELSRTKKIVPNLRLANRSYLFRMTETFTLEIYSFQKKNDKNYSM